MAHLYISYASQDGEWYDTVLAVNDTGGWENTAEQRPLTG